MLSLENETKENGNPPLSLCSFLNKNMNIRQVFLLGKMKNVNHVNSMVSKIAMLIIVNRWGTMGGPFSLFLEKGPPPIVPEKVT